MISLILPFPECHVIGIMQSSYSLFTLTSFTQQSTFGIHPFVRAWFINSFPFITLYFFKKPKYLFVSLDWDRHVCIHLEKSEKYHFVSKHATIIHLTAQARNPRAVPAASSSLLTFDLSPIPEASTPAYISNASIFLHFYSYYPILTTSSLSLAP